MTDFNASNRKDIAAARKAARQVEANRGEVVKSMMNTATGREYFWNKLALAHIFSAVPPTDALAMAFAEGERNQGLQLLNDIMQWCPELFIQAMRESHERNQSSASAAAQHTGGEDAGGDDSESSPEAGDDSRAEDA